MLNYLVLKCIRFYQVVISPRKGYSCAHGRYYGGDSCSTAIYKIIQRQGIWSSRTAIKAQFARCSFANQQMNQSKRKKSKNSYCCELPCDCIGDLPSRFCSDSDSSMCDCSDCGFN